RIFAMCSSQECWRSCHQTDSLPVFVCADARSLSACSCADLRASRRPARDRLGPCRSLLSHGPLLPSRGQTARSVAPIRPSQPPLLVGAGFLLNPAYFKSRRRTATVVSQPQAATGVILKALAAIEAVLACARSPLRFGLVGSHGIRRTPLSS